MCVAEINAENWVSAPDQSNLSGWMWMGVWSINFAFAACAHVATVSCGIDALETQSGIANTLQGSTALRKELWKRGPTPSTV
jgi:hypothetical protein